MEFIHESLVGQFQLISVDRSPYGSSMRRGIVKPVNLHFMNANTHRSPFQSFKLNGCLYVFYDSAGGNWIRRL